MADYARQGDAARTLASHARQIRQLRVRHLTGHVPSPAFIMEGPITVGRVFPRAPVIIDPLGTGAFAEFKQIVAVDGDLISGGSVTIEWWDTGVEIATAATTITAGTDNRLTLAEPWVIDPAATAWVQPVIVDVSGSPLHLSCVFVVETVPI